MTGAHGVPIRPPANFRTACTATRRRTGCTDPQRNRREIISPPFRAVLLKSLGMTLVFLALAWVGLDRLALSYAVVNHPWLQTVLVYATGFGLFFLLAFFIGPISVIVSGLFLDDLADALKPFVPCSRKRWRLIEKVRVVHRFRSGVA